MKLGKELAQGQRYLAKVNKSTLQDPIFLLYWGDCPPKGSLPDHYRLVSGHFYIPNLAITHPLYLAYIGGLLAKKAAKTANEFKRTCEQDFNRTVLDNWIAIITCKCYMDELIIYYPYLHFGMQGVGRYATLSVHLDNDDVVSASDEPNYDVYSKPNDNRKIEVIYSEVVIQQEIKPYAPMLDMIFRIAHVFKKTNLGQVPLDHGMQLINQERTLLYYPAFHVDDLFQFTYATVEKPRELLL